MGHDLAPRIEKGKFYEGAKEGVDAMMRLSKAVAESGLEHELQELVKLRSSQINGCAFCLQMHSTDARRIGVSEERMQLLPAWREVGIYSERERAALGLCEALTRVAEGGMPEEVFEEARWQFSEKELAWLILAVATINAWNRIAIACRATPELKK